MTSYVMCNKKKLGIKKSDITFLKKSIDDRKLEYFKRELLKILDKKEKEEESENEVSKAFIVQDLYKSMTDPLYMAKGGKVGVVGEVRTWNGKKYKKMPNKKWVRVYDKETRGAKLSIAALRRKIDACTNSQELLNLVLANKDRFCDELGRPLPIVQELSKYTSKKNDELETPTETRNLKQIKRENGASYGEKRDRHIREDMKLNNVKLDYKETTVKEAREKLDELQKEGVPLKNKETGLEAFVVGNTKAEMPSPKAINKSKVNGFTEQEHLNAVENIKTLFENANFVSEEPDRNLDISDAKLDVKRFAVEVEINGKKGFAVISVHHINGNQGKKEIDESKNKHNLYFVELKYLTKKISSDFKSSRTSKKDLQGNTQSEPKNNIAQDYSDVNKKDEKSERAAVVEKHIEDKLNEYMNDSYTKSSAYGFVKKYGKARLEKIAEGTVKSDEEYKKWLNDKIADIEKERGEDVSDYTIDTAIWKHCIAFYEREAAREKLKSMDANEKEPDLPVDEKDMQEAKNIIGADVKRILDGRDTYGNAKQTLTDKIKRRIRNNPGVARAMLVYIKQEQEKTGKKVYTEKHSIWEELPKLNENAKEAMKTGESETKTGVSGNLYEGEDGTTVVENKDWGRYQISFPGKPDSETISMLKHNGFRWSPKTQTWVCFNTSNGEYSLKRVAEKLGLKKTGDVKKSYAAIIGEMKKAFFERF